MTKQEAYDELKSYRNELMVCEHVRRRMKELKEQMTSVKITDYSNNVHGAQSERVEELIDKIDKLSVQFYEQLLYSEQVRKGIERKIATLHFPFADILRMRYIDKLSYEEMSVKMSTNYRQHYSYEYMRFQSFKGVELYKDLEI